MLQAMFKQPSVAKGKHFVAFMPSITDYMLSGPGIRLLPDQRLTTTLHPVLHTWPKHKVNVIFVSNVTFDIPKTIWGHGKKFRQLYDSVFYKSLCLIDKLYEIIHYVISTICTLTLYRWIKDIKWIRFNRQIHNARMVFALFPRRFPVQASN